MKLKKKPYNCSGNKPKQLKKSKKMSTKANNIEVKNEEVVKGKTEENPTETLLKESEAQITTRVGEGLEKTKAAKSTSYAIKAIEQHLKTLELAGLVDEHQATAVRGVMEKAVIKWFKL